MNEVLCMYKEEPEEERSEYRSGVHHARFQALHDTRSMNMMRGKKH